MMLVYDASNISINPPKYFQFTINGYPGTQNLISTVPVRDSLPDCPTLNYPHAQAPAFIISTDNVFHSSFKSAIAARGKSIQGDRIQ
jgi:hypothetical protein